MKKLLSICLVMASIVTVLSFNASAYNLFSGSLNGGVTSRYYYLGVSATKYVNACNGAVSDWHYAVNQVSFTRTYSGQ